MIDLIAVATVFASGIAIGALIGVLLGMVWSKSPAPIMAPIETGVYNPDTGEKIVDPYREDGGVVALTDAHDETIATEFKR